MVERTERNFQGVKVLGSCKSGGKGNVSVKSKTSKYSTYSAKDLKVGDVIPSTVYKNGKNEQVKWTMVANGNKSFLNGELTVTGTQSANKTITIFGDFSKFLVSGKESDRNVMLKFKRTFKKDDVINMVTRK